MHPNLLNPKICVASLDENCEPSDPNNTAHVWDDTTDPVTCSECGTTQDEDNQ